MKKWGIRLSVTLNVVVLVLVIAAYLGSGTLLRGFLAGMYERKVSFFGSFTVTPGATVFLGDSITEGAEWQEMFPELAIRNRGIGGDTTTGVLQRLEQITAAAPARVLLMIGTNDLTHGPDSRDTSYAQYQEIVTRLQAAQPAPEIYLQSILPRAGDMREEVENYNSMIREYATERGITFIDLYPHFLAEDGSIRDEFSNDELHLNGPGYQLWQQQLRPYLN